MFIFYFSFYTSHPLPNLWVGHMWIGFFESEHQKKPITKHRPRGFIFIFYFIFTLYTHYQNVIICGQCFWKWTPKNPSPNKGNLTLDVHFCFNFYTPHLWPSCLGDKCWQAFFLNVQKKKTLSSNRVNRLVIKYLNI